METISKISLILVLLLIVDFQEYSSSLSFLAPEKQTAAFAPAAPSSAFSTEGGVRRSAILVQATETTKLKLQAKDEQQQHNNDKLNEVPEKQHHQEASKHRHTLLNDDGTSCISTFANEPADSTYHHHHHLKHAPQQLRNAILMNEKNKQNPYETTIFGYKIFNPFAAFGIRSTSTYSENIEERDILSDYQDDIIGFSDPSIGGAAAGAAVGTEDHDNVFKLHCVNTSIANINEVLKSKKYIKYTHITLQHSYAESMIGAVAGQRVVKVPLQLQQFESVHQFHWLHSAVVDQQLQELFLNYETNFEYLESLDLSGNRIECLNWLRPQVGRRLKVLKLTGNHINSEQCDLTPLHNTNLLLELRLDNNRLRSLHGKYLANLSELKVLNLTGNELSDVPRQTFDGVFKLQRLHMAHNALRVLPFQLFQKLRDLQILNLADNQLLSFPDNFFALNSELRIVQLQRNQLQSINKNTFYNLDKLLHLDLSENQIASIDRRAFDSLSNLVTLNISFNNISTVSSILFHSLQRLQHLDLSNNRFTQLPSGIFMHQRNLISLRIDHTPMDKLNNWLSRSDDSYVNSDVLKHLTHLSMQNNRNLRKLTKTLFHNAPNLRVLLLAHNSLVQLPAEISALHNLERLSVGYNNLSYLPEGLRFLPNLHYINILNNDYICDCKLYWLSSWLTTTGNTTLRLHRRSLRSLADSTDEDTDFSSAEKAEDLDLLISSLKCLHGYPGDMISVLQSLNCSKPTLQSSTDITMHELHSTAKLYCAFKGSPSPDVIWVRMVKCVF